MLEVIRNCHVLPGGKKAVFVGGAFNLLEQIDFTEDDACERFWKAVKSPAGKDGDTFMGFSISRSHKKYGDVPYYTDIDTVRLVSRYNEVISEYRIEEQ